jgi:hypothetical protein
MQTNYRKYALLIGISLILMAVLAGFSYGYVFKGFAATANQNFFYNSPANAKWIFINGMIGWIGILVSWGLCHYYHRVHKTLSNINAALRIAYSLILGWAISILVQQSQVFTVEYSTSEKVDIIQAALHYFEQIWSYGLIVFGFHLVVWGILSLKAHFISKIWGVLFIIAGISYSFIHTVKSFSWLPPDIINSVEQILMLPMMIAEVGFAIWLLIKR